MDERWTLDRLYELGAEVRVNRSRLERVEADIEHLKELYDRMLAAESRLDSSDKADSQRDHNDEEKERLRPGHRGFIISVLSIAIAAVSLAFTVVWTIWHTLTAHAPP